MRLFIAVNFPENVKNMLYNKAEEIRHISYKGNFTSYENFHLTLVFIGEVDESRMQSVRAAMDEAIKEFNSFELCIRNLGRFDRNGSSIVWAGIEKNNALIELQRDLVKELAIRGFTVEKREYKPHLTLGREVVFKEDFDAVRASIAIPKVEMQVTKISLMKSERVKGKLIYTEMYKA